MCTWVYLKQTLGEMSFAILTNRALFCRLLKTVETMEEKGYLEKVSGGGRSAVLQLTLDEFDPTDGKLQLTLGDLAPPTVSFVIYVLCCCTV